VTSCFWRHAVENLSESRTNITSITAAADVRAKLLIGVDFSFVDLSHSWLVNVPLASFLGSVIINRLFSTHGVHDVFFEGYAAY
jgi:hypothetical protein